MSRETEVIASQRRLHDTLSLSLSLSLSLTCALRVSYSKRIPYSLTLMNGEEGEGRTRKEEKQHSLTCQWVENWKAGSRHPATVS